MSDPLIGRIREVDPAQNLSDGTDTVREATRRMIVQSAVPTEYRARSAASVAQRSRRRLVLALVVALVVIVPSTAVAFVEFWPGAQADTVLEESTAAEKDFPLPAGAEWTVPGFLLSDDGSWYGPGEGFSTAWGQALELWCWEWLDAHDAADTDRQAAATQALERLFGMVHPIEAGDSENGSAEHVGVVVVDENGIALFARMLDGARRGDPTAIKDFLKANATYRPSTDAL